MVKILALLSLIFGQALAYNRLQLFLNGVVNQLKEFNDSEGNTTEEQVLKTDPVVEDSPFAITGSGDGPSSDIPGGPAKRKFGTRLPDLVSTDFAHLLNYGCYCNFDSMKLGFGTNVDYIDGICKQLFTNYHCLSEDGCDSKNLQYESGMAYFYTAQSIAFKNLGLTAMSNIYIQKAYDLCEELNVAYCKIGICKAEIHFTFNLLPEGLHQETDPEAALFNNKSGFYSDEYESYDKSECRISRNNGGSGINNEFECCRESPYMVRFNSIGQTCSAGEVIDLFL